MTKKYWTAIAASIVLALVLLILTTRDSSNETVAVGAILPLTGDVATYGKSIKNGIELAINDVNASGGIDGKNVKMIYEDDGGSPRSGVTAVTKLISVDDVPAIIGAVPSSVTLAIAPIAERKKRVLLSPASSSPKITNAGDFIFRNYPSDELEGRLVAELCISRQDMTAGILTINNDYGVGLNAVFSKTYEALGGRVVVDESYLEDTTDFRTLLATIKQHAPSCIFIVGYGRDLGTLVRQARELQIKAQFYSTVNFLDPQSLSTGGDAVEGVIFSSPVFDANSHEPQIKAFVKKYQTAFSESPDVWAAHGYDAMLLLVEAMRSHGTTPENIKSGLYAISEFPGVSGTTTIDENGDVIKTARFMTVHEGVFVPYD